MQPDQPTDSRPLTPLGTPLSSAWDAAHIALVEAREAELDRRICGARTLSGVPCSLGPNHENGRCKYHGGFNLTGAPVGNRNATVHGLYSRAIQVCGEQCPMWNTCPCASPEVAKLPGPERPQCPYEVAAYNAALTDARAGLAARVEKENRAADQPACVAQPMADQAACTLAMMQVMVLRASAALAVKPMVDMSVVTSEKYNSTSAKPSAYLQAFMRISSEQRRYLRMYAMDTPVTASDAVIIEQDLRGHADTSLLPEDLVELDQPETPGQRRAAMLLTECERRISKGDHERAKYAFSRAQFLSPELAALAHDPNSEFFLPRFHQVYPMKLSG
ncbi:MAG: hypothetical protein IT367_13590 [Candidatus Hydrogenedentes bacterium]|nr:hypothetical protein [Candidatus Hydrogenedentota bacterium]